MESRAKLANVTPMRIGTIQSRRRRACLSMGAKRAGVIRGSIIPLFTTASAASCARAGSDPEIAPATGQPTAPPNSVTNSRRFID